MNKVSFVFSLFEAAGENDAAPGVVGFQRAGERRGGGHFDDSLEHLDHVIDRVFLVIQNDDVIQPFLLCGGPLGDFRFEDGFRRHGNSLNEISRHRRPLSYDLHPWPDMSQLLMMKRESGTS
jgi:hypothetical protein